MKKQKIDLDIWCTKGAEQRYGDYSIAGAIAGRDFGLSNSNDVSLINNFEWLEKQFNA